MTRRKGFSLIELLIVVAIILIVAALAIPNLVRSRMAANEASAVASVRTLTSAEVMYSSFYPAVGYTCEPARLGPYKTIPSEEAAGIIDDVLAKGNKSGYNFTITHCTGDPVSTFFVTAVPVPGAGVRKFCSSEPGVIHYETTTSDCTEASPSLR